MDNRDALASADAADEGPPAPSTAALTDPGDPNRDSTPARTAHEPPRGQSEHRSRSRRSHRHTGHSSGNSGGSRYDRQRRQTLIARVIAILALAACVILTMLFIRVKSQLATHNMETGTLASELNRTRGELVQTKQLVAAQEVELGALIKQRLPGVNALEIEKLNDINKGYVKKLMFSETGAGTDKRLAYSIVLKNASDQPVTPEVNLILFDRKGLQTGIARVTPAAATVPDRKEAIQPGETRSYAGVVERIRGGEPHAYYLVEVN